MAGEVTDTCISSVYFHNTNDSCFISSMVEYPSCYNGALGAGFLNHMQVLFMLQWCCLRVMEKEC